jgi:hypothetical protein
MKGPFDEPQANRIRIELYPRRNRKSYASEIAIVISRYDRQYRGNDIARAYQEDACQSLGIMPTRKYQDEGGLKPGQHFSRRGPAI